MVLVLCKDLQSAHTIHSTVHLDLNAFMFSQFAMILHENHASGKEQKRLHKTQSSLGEQHLSLESSPLPMHEGAHKCMAKPYTVPRPHVRLVIQLFPRPMVAYPHLSLQKKTGQSHPAL